MKEIEEAFLRKENHPWYTSEGILVPKYCPECEAKIGIFIDKNKAIFACEGKDNHYFGDLPEDEQVGDNLAHEINHSELNYIYNNLGDYIEHHGKVGMHWGVKNGPPYPLGQGEGYKVGSPLSYEKINSLKGNTKETSTTNEVNSTRKKTYLAAIGSAVGAAGSIAASVALPEIAPFGLAIGSSLAASSAISIGKIIKTETGKSKANEKAERFKAERVGPIDKNTGLHKKTREYTREEDMERVNPNFNTWDDGNKNNCAYSTITYDLRRRGYDVTAPKSMDGMTASEQESFYKNAKTDYMSSNLSLQQMNMRKNWGDTGDMLTSRKIFKEAINNIESQGEGARGKIGVVWAGAMSGHAMAYEVIDGKAHIFDTQANKEYKPSILSNTGLPAEIWAANVTRYDNLKLNNKKIKEVFKDD